MEAELALVVEHTADPYQPASATTCRDSYPNSIGWESCRTFLAPQVGFQKGPGYPNTDLVRLPAVDTKAVAVRLAEPDSQTFECIRQVAAAIAVQQELPG